MRQEHTPEQWRELIDRLTALANNPAETYERREKAKAILRKIERSPQAATSTSQRQPKVYGARTTYTSMSLDDYDASIR